MPTQQTSNGDSMPTVPTLTAEVARLTQAVNGWNTAILVMMVVAASAALGLVVTPWKALKKAEELAAVTSQLSELKESISGAKIEKSAQDAHAATIASIAAQQKLLKQKHRRGRLNLNLVSNKKKQL